MSNLKKTFYLNDKPVNKKNIPDNAVLLGENRGFYRPKGSKKDVQFKEEFYISQS